MKNIKYNGPKVIVCGGKGGTGKTTTSCEIAYSLANSGKRVILLDCNKKGARGIIRAYSPEGKIPFPERGSRKTFKLGISNLIAGGTSVFKYDSLQPMEDKGSKQRNLKRDNEFKIYMKQFPGAFGVVPFTDLWGTFFGGFTSPQQAIDFITLSNLYIKNADKADYFVLDMKASDDFSEMFFNAAKSANSLERMHSFGFASLWGVRNVLRMPDIERYLKTSFVKEHAPKYIKQMRQTALALTNAKFILVSGREQEKVNEFLEDLQPLVDEIEKERRQVTAYLQSEMLVREWESAPGRRGKGKKPKRIPFSKIPKQENTLAYVVNDLQKNLLDNDEAESQKRQIKRVKQAATKKGVEFIEVWHDKNLGAWDECPDNQRKQALLKEGNKIVSKLNLIQMVEN